MVSPPVPPAPVYVVEFHVMVEDCPAPPSRCVAAVLALVADPPPRPPAPTATTISSVDDAATFVTK